MKPSAKFKTIVKALIPLLIIVTVAWVLELAVFNLPAVETMGLGEGRAVSVQGSAQEDEDGMRTIMFRNIDERVISVEFHVESEEVVAGAFLDSDEGAAADHIIGEFRIVPGDPNSRFYIVDAHGEVSRLGV